MDKPRLWIVVPCYNEQEVLPITAPHFRDKILELAAAGKISGDSRVLFVNDGSSDKTWSIIQGLSKEDEHYIGISQSRNRGHQNTLLAGLMEAKDKCDITISIDCDGQDDINAMNEMVDRYHEGCEIVYGVRAARKKDSWFKRNSAQSFYKFLKFLGADTVYNHADYRLVSNRVLNHFADFKEVNIYLRGMFPLVGFTSTSVEYEREERLAGKSHYPLGKMIRLAIEGITSLSTKPISIITAIGMFTIILGIIGIIWACIMVAIHNTVAGWASLACIIIFLGGIQILSLGVIGEYIGKIYMETKHRPRFIISEKTWDDSAEDKEVKDV